jgi:HEAT repeat protein
MKSFRRVLACSMMLGAPACAEDTGYPGYGALREKAASLWTNRNEAGGAYVALVPEGSPLTKAAKKLADYRKGEVLAFSPDDPAACLPDLIARNARHVAIFVEPKDMDVNLLRRFIVLSTLLDADPFCDFAFGFITASSPKQVDSFVDRILAADRNGLPDRSVMVSASNVSVKYDTGFLPGMKGESWYVKQGDTAYAKEALARLEGAGFVHFGACSDPEGIWLFDDERNLDPSKHWPYDPKRVGQDPEGVMPRITASYFRDVKLSNAVVWTHACHLGAVDRVYVEGDIVSTFGATEKVEMYRIPEGRSMALAIIDAGVSAYICPIGANFGAQSSLEKDIATETGVPLGDVLRRGYHDVVMDTGGHPELIGVFVAGKPKHWDPDGFRNNNSPQHRCLYGDPLMAPFEKRLSPATVVVTSKEEDGGVRIAFRLTASGFDVGRTWYGNRGRGERGRGRFYEEIAVSGDVDEAWIRSVKTANADGKPFGLSSHSVLVEKIDGRTVLHVQIVTPDLDSLEMGGGNPAQVSVLAKAGATAEVFVKFGARPAGKEGEADLPGASDAKPGPAEPKEPAGDRGWRDGPANETPESAARLKTLLAALRKAKGPDEVVARGQAVLDIGRLRTPAALRALLDVFGEEKEPYVRSLIVSAIAEVDGKDAAAALLHALASEESPALRQNLRNAIVHTLGSREIADVLLRQGLRHRDARARAASASALGRLRWTEASGALVAATKDADAAVRLAAIEALRCFATKEVLDCLLGLAEGSDEEAACAAVWSLEETGSGEPRVLDVARRLLSRSKPASLQAAAARFLGARRDVAAVKPLLGLLSSTDWRLRAAAVAAFGRIRHKDTIEPLIARLGEETGRLLADTAQALADVTGLALGTDAKRWKDWWKEHGGAFEVPPDPPAAAAAPGDTEVTYHDIPVVSKRLIFVLDVSASMAEAMDAKSIPSDPAGGPAGNTRLDFCKWELKKTIRRLPKDVRFNVITFDTAVHSWRTALAQANAAGKAEAEAFVDRQTPVGATNLSDALKAAFEDREADTFYVLGDGQPTEGPITNSAELLAWVRRLNAARGVVIHAISAGEMTAVTDDLLRKLAEQNGGRCVTLK